MKETKTYWNGVDYKLSIDHSKEVGAWGVTREVCFLERHWPDGAIHDVSNGTQAECEAAMLDEIKHGLTVAKWNPSEEVLCLKK